MLQALRARGLPVVVTMGGGYAEPIEHTVEIYFNTVRATAWLAVSRRSPKNRVNRAA